MMSDARPKTRIAAKKFLHAVRIACEDDHEILAMVLHDLQQDLDSLLAVASLVVRTVQMVDLINEQEAALVTLHTFLCLRRSASILLPDEAFTPDAHHLT